MSRRGELWLGDLADSLRLLAARNDRTCAAIARLAGFRLTREGGSDARRRPDVEARGRTRSATDRTPATRPPTPAPYRPSTQKSEAIGEILTPVRTDAGELARPWAAEPPLEPVTAVHLEASCPHMPLLDPKAEREILFAATARRAAIGAVDARRIVSIVANGRPLRSIPRLSRLTLGAGVQLLLDAGPGMDPYQRDQAEFATLLEAIVGKDGLETRLFVGSPLHGVDGPGGREAYSLPPPGRPVVLLTDFGLGGPAGDSDRFSMPGLLALLDVLEAQDSRTLAFIPYPRRRLPRPLLRRMVILEWDRHTTVSAVRHAIEDAGAP